MNELYQNIGKIQVQLDYHQVALQQLSQAKAQLYEQLRAAEQEHAKKEQEATKQENPTEPESLETAPE